MTDACTGRIGDAELSHFGATAADHSDLSYLSNLACHVATELISSVPSLVFKGGGEGGNRTRASMVEVSLA